MNKEIPHLQQGDLIRIISPAKAIEVELIQYAKNLLEQRGYRVKVGTHAAGRWNYFSGTDEQRLQDMQEALDDPDCKAIICSRGGYGCVRIVDLLNWAGFLRQPKWIVGFSDVTVFHHHIQRFGIQSIHASMPLNFQDNTQEAIESLFYTLEGKAIHYQFTPSSSGNDGEAEGILIGGNLSIIYSLLGTDDRLNFENKILFIEDLNEQLYALDRMWNSLNKAGVFDQLSGLLVGGITDMKDTEPKSGLTIENIIMDKFSFRNTPVAFNFPAGHINDNRALIFGKHAQLTINKEIATLVQS
mgnify:CR=1 FL=1